MAKLKTDTAYFSECSYVVLIVDNELFDGFLNGQLTDIAWQLSLLQLLQKYSQLAMQQTTK